MSLGLALPMVACTVGVLDEPASRTAWAKGTFRSSVVYLAVLVAVLALRVGH